MNRLLTSLLAASCALTVGVGSALANPGHGHAMGNGAAMHSTMMTPHQMSVHHNHRYGNDKARCRDAKGRFLKKTDARCLAK